MKAFKFLLVASLLLSSPIFAAGHCSKYISVREYEVKDSNEVASIAQKEFVPIIKKITGFISLSRFQILIISPQPTNQQKKLKSGEKKP